MPIDDGWVQFWRIVHVFFRNTHPSTEILRTFKGDNALAVNKLLRSGILVEENGRCRFTISLRLLDKYLPQCGDTLDGIISVVDNNRKMLQL